MKNRKFFPPNIRMKTKMPTLVIAIQHCTGSSRQGNEARMRNKSHPNWDVKSEAIYFHMTSHITENSRVY